MAGWAEQGSWRAGSGSKLHLPGLEITGAVPGGLQMPSGSFWEHQELQPLCHCSSVLALCLMTSFELGERSQDSSKSLVWAVIPGE